MSNTLQNSTKLYINGIYHNIPGCNDLGSVAPATMASEFVRFENRDAPAVFSKASCPCHVVQCFHFFACGRRPKNRAARWTMSSARVAASLDRPADCNAFGCRTRRLGWLQCFWLPLVCISCQALLHALQCSLTVQIHWENLFFYTLYNFYKTSHN